MKVILITNDSMNSKALETLMVKSGINLIKVIQIKRKQQKTNFLKLYASKLRRTLGKIKNLITQNSQTKTALKFEQKCIESTDKKLSAYLENKLKDQTKTDVKHFEVSNVNSEEVVAELRKKSPGLCVVWGTAILKKNILQECKTFLNAHTSILPHYRGTRSEFWQCYENNLDTVGVTFHQIDVGVDTGPIFKQIHQKEITFIEPYQLRLQNTILVLENYPQLIKDVISGDAKLTWQVEKESV